MSWWLITYVGIGWVIRVTMIPVLLRRQFAPGAAIAWLGIVFLHPYIGLALYLLVGETNLGRRRIERHRELVNHFRTEGLLGRQSLRPELDQAYHPIMLQAEKISGMPAVGPGEVEFLDDAKAMVDHLIADIDAAQSHVHLLYYIFFPDETGRRVAAAISAAARRGVKCRLLADALASRALFSAGLTKQMEAAGVQVRRALPGVPLRRRDLRNHRKMALIDDRLGYVGSHNLVNPDYGGRRGAPWYDVTARLSGPVVNRLAIVFAEDWAFETDELLEPTPAEKIESRGDSTLQVVPTGPLIAGQSYRRVLLAAVNAARQRLILTTPYFVPDEPTLVSFMMAADRGVQVDLILPLVPDHFFTAAAGRAHFQSLLQAGIRIYQYRPGLVHAKTATVDDAFALFGSANLDVRSFNLNFELSVLAYGPQVTQRLRKIQLGYIEQSCRLEIGEWAKRSVLKRYADSAISLLSPLL